MAAIHGKRGVATFAGLTLEITDFSVNGTTDIEDATVMDVSAVSASTHWKTKLAGFKDWTASITGVLPVAGIGIAALGTSATLTVDTTDGLAFSGTAFCSAISPTNPIGVATVTMEFEGSGQLSEA